MKITKRNNPPKNRLWSGFCRSCGSEAEAKESELTNIVSSQRDGCFSWEKCPVCDVGPYGGMIMYPTVVNLTTRHTTVVAGKKIADKSKQS